MKLSLITPLLLTYNEEANINRTLDRLTWADRIVIVDSYSEDATVEIVRSYENVDLLQREFDHFDAQCNYGLEQIDTEWVLSLDADYLCSEELISEIRSLPASPAFDGFSVEFIYCVHGHPLRGSLYPPRTVLYRRKQAKYHRDGHSHRVRIDGNAGKLETPIYHDDRKPLSEWLDNQRRYCRLEIDKLEETSEVTLVDRVRKTGVLAPILIPFYCLFVQGLILDGWPGWYYALQRTYTELLLALKLIDRNIRRQE
ncbi:MAG: glycosyl transferase [Bacteroidetes bacterium SW_9_63_38]|nr:MAG: glycosyl transferase [Bacteroidetes bacterium SW_9_63_38]